MEAFQREDKPVTKQKENTVVYNEYEGGKYLGRQNNPYYLLVKGPESGVIHPETVEIRHWAFGKLQNLRSVIVPESVRRIGVSAFKECPNLEEVHLPEQLEEIPLYAFTDCVRLHDINIPVSLKMLGGDAFRNCVSLKQIHIPYETEIGTGTFYGCTQLADENKLVIVNGILMQDYRYLSDVTIPEGIWKIDPYAYGDSNGECYGYRKIRYDQFYHENREKIRTITLPSTLKELGPGAFRYCDNLEHVELNEGLEIIWSSAFAGCMKLRSVEIPHSVKIVCVYAFAYCKNLETVILHSGIENLPSCAFEGSSNINEIIVPESWDRIPGFRRVLRSEKGKRESAWYKEAIRQEKDEIARILHLIKRTGKD
jgi:hypothetical protein